MGYKMPIVAKTIIIPVDGYVDINHPTLDEYKEHFGIDLTEFFEFTTSSNILYRPKTNAKIFVSLGNDSSIYNQGVYPLFMGTDSDERNVIILERTSGADNLRGVNYMAYNVNTGRLEIGEF